MNTSVLQCHERAYVKIEPSKPVMWGPLNILIKIWRPMLDLYNVFLAYPEGFVMIQESFANHLEEGNKMELNEEIVMESCKTGYEFSWVLEGTLLQIQQRAGRHGTC